MCLSFSNRHAALMAISAVGEGCHKQMEAILHQIMEGIMPFLQDPVSLKIFFFLINVTTDRVSSHFKI